MKSKLFICAVLTCIFLFHVISLNASVVDAIEGKAIAKKKYEKSENVDSKIKTLYFSGAHSDVKFEGWDKEEVKIKARILIFEYKSKTPIEEFLESYEYFFKKDSDSITLYRNPINFDGNRSSNIQFTINLPKRLLLKVSNHSHGNLDLINCNGGIDLDHSHGTVSIDNESITNKLKTNISHSTTKITVKKLSEDTLEFDLDQSHGRLNLDLPGLGKRFKLRARHADTDVKTTVKSDQMGDYKFDVQHDDLDLDFHGLAGKLVIDSAHAEVSLKIKEKTAGKLDMNIEIQHDDLEAKLPDILGDLKVKSQHADIEFDFDEYSYDKVKTHKIDVDYGDVESNILKQYDSSLDFSEGEILITTNKDSGYRVDIENSHGDLKYEK
ncbi:MAG: hypothetical protein ABIA04_10785 [Pseudomonadota bacterium]